MESKNPQPKWQFAKYKAYLINLETHEKMVFLFNPPEFSETVVPMYDEVTIHGMSQGLMRFKATKPLIWDLELYANLHLVSADQDISSEDAARTINDMRNFLLSLTIPSRRYMTYIGGSPPLATFIWPGVVCCDVRLTGLKFNFDQFTPDLDLLAYRAQVQLTESRDSRKWSEELRVWGSVFAESGGRR